MVSSIVGLFGVVFSIVGLSDMISPAWCTPSWDSPESPESPLRHGLVGGTLWEGRSGRDTPGGILRGMVYSLEGLSGISGNFLSSMVFSNL